MDPITASSTNITNSTDTYGTELNAFEEPYQKILTAIYIITAILAFIANTTAITMLITNRRSSSQLTKYLINLFTTDIIIALSSIPMSNDMMYGKWIFPLFMCPITQFISVCALCVCVYTLIAIGIERYLAIVYPFEQLMCFERHTESIIAFIWIIGFSLGSPQLIKSRAIPISSEFPYRDEKLYDCREIWEQELGGRVYTAIMFIITFVIPFFALSFLYTSIGLTTFRQKVPGNAHSVRDHIQQRNKIKMAKMLVFLVISFAICWLPIQLFHLIMWLCDSCRTFSNQFESNLYYGTFCLFHFLSMAHTLIDPIIYSFMSHNFKFEEFRSLIFCNCTVKSKNRTMNRNNERSTIRTQFTDVNNESESLSDDNAKNTFV